MTKLNSEALARYREGQELETSEKSLAREEFFRKDREMRELREERRGLKHLDRYHKRWRKNKEGSRQRAGGNPRAGINAGKERYMANATGEFKELSAPAQVALLKAAAKNPPTDANGIKKLLEAANSLSPEQRRKIQALIAPGAPGWLPPSMTAPVLLEVADDLTLGTTHWKNKKPFRIKYPPDEEEDTDVAVHGFDRVADGEIALPHGVELMDAEMAEERDELLAERAVEEKGTSPEVRAVERKIETCVDRDEEEAREGPPPGRRYPTRKAADLVNQLAGEIAERKAQLATRGQELIAGQEEYLQALQEKVKELEGTKGKDTEALGHVRANRHMDGGVLGGFSPTTKEMVEDIIPSHIMPGEETERYLELKAATARFEKMIAEREANPGLAKCDGIGTWKMGHKWHKVPRQAIWMCGGCGLEVDTRFGDLCRGKLHRITGSMSRDAKSALHMIEAGRFDFLPAGTRESLKKGNVSLGKLRETANQLLASGSIEKYPTELAVLDRDGVPDGMVVRPIIVEDVRDTVYSEHPEHLHLCQNCGTYKDAHNTVVEKGIGAVSMVPITYCPNHSTDPT